MTSQDLLEQIFIRDGQNSYWVEYRRANFTNSYKAGLVIYRTDPPPSSAILSPNPEDALSADPGDGVTTDYWMLNWDDYRYVRSQASGSMTLPYGKVATTFSGAVSLSAAPTNSDRSVMVTINRSADVTPPPTPEMTNPKSWTSPQDSILTEGYEDRESIISSFQTLIDGKVSSISNVGKYKQKPTFLNPFGNATHLTTNDLPEGNYALQIRAMDIWGNISPWSTKVNVRIDRGAPRVSREFVITSADVTSTQVQWKGLRDEGVGLCDTFLHNEDGFVTYRSQDSANPSLQLSTGVPLDSTFQAFDCLGNGIEGKISLISQWWSHERTKKTGSWSPAAPVYGSAATRCSGRCSLSLSLRSDASVVLGEGSAEIFLAGNKVASAASSKRQQSRFFSVTGPAQGSRVLRISGENFVFVGIGTLQSKVSSVTPITKRASIIDPSLNDPIQKDLARFGFSSQDFTSEWTVLPIARGTTLDDPTLDLCGSNYSSEKDRLFRRQVGVTRASSNYQFLSTEVVRYASATAASAALGELRARIAQCSLSGGAVESGVQTPYQFLEFAKQDSFLFQSETRVSVRARIGTGSSQRNLIAFYQVEKELFTGLYLVISADAMVSDQEILRWTKVAATLLDRMQNTKNTQK